MFSLLVVACACACAGGVASGATATWTGGGDQLRWSDAANWSPGCPASGDDVVVPLSAAITIDGAAETAYHGLSITADGVTLSGGVLRMSGGIVVGPATGAPGPMRATITSELVADTDLAVSCAKGATLVLGGAIDLRDHHLMFQGEGAIEVAGAVRGAGGVDCRGPGRVSLSGPSSFAGGFVAHGGEVRVDADVPAAGDSPCGAGETPLGIDGGTLLVNTPMFARPLAIGPRGGRLDAFGAARSVAAPIVTASWSNGGITGTYLPESMRGVVEDDWRGHHKPASIREDALINFPNQAFGTSDEQRAFHIAGTPADWDDFSIQWDGYLRIETDGTSLSTRSDDGSRMWIDLNHDGKVQSDEWGSNGWGGGQGATVKKVSGPLPVGVYQIRVQYEEGGGGNTMSLLWDDRRHGTVSLGGLMVVPTEDFLRTASFTIGGEPVASAGGQQLTLAGPISGQSEVVKDGGSVALFAAENSYASDTRILGGTLACARDRTLPPTHLEIGPGARLDARGHAQALAGISGDGECLLSGAALTLTGNGSFIGRMPGRGSVHKQGEGAIALLGEISDGVAFTLAGGSIRFASGRILAAVQLQAPLTTTVMLPSELSGARQVDCLITVPANAPDDLGGGVCVADQHGHWFQRFADERLVPGKHHLRFALGEGASLHSEPWSARWDAAASSSNRTGLFFWSASGSRASVQVDCRVSRLQPVPASGVELIDGASPAAPAHPGERLEWSCRPQPFPENPYDPQQFSLTAVFTGPDGTETRIPGFYIQRMASRDRGDREEVQPIGEEAFAVRFRPRVPGHWRLRLEALWQGGRTVACEQPAFEVSGEPWDDYVHVDHDDPRFFSAGGTAGASTGASTGTSGLATRFVWPIGLNIRSVNDQRSLATLGTRITPDRGSLSYRAYLERLAAAGGTGVEIWLAPWNLGLEWRADWTGFYGQGRYNQENAFRLDEVLDCAYRLGIRVNLVVTNHGQGSEGSDPEWDNSPYNTANGGKLARAAEFFTAEWALAGQQAYRRYLVARYADHPAILGWKLWSEVNLTAAGGNVVRWHEQAAERWHALDTYGHPITTHWAGDYGAVDHGVVALRGIDYICIDAYHTGQLLAQLLVNGISDPGRGLGRFGKPILVTECGGNWNAGPPAEIEAEQANGPWAAFVSGNAGSPMLWWYEYVDQHELWKPYGAIARFIAGEDLRGGDAGSSTFPASSPAGALWCRAWRRPGRVLGYVLDRRWGMRGGDAPTHDAARVDLGKVAPGTVAIEWWDADHGVAVKSETIVYDGASPLVLLPPAFARHIAFKLSRDAAPAKLRVESIDASAPLRAKTAPVPVPASAEGK